jgi:hypothetical protein
MTLEELEALCREAAREVLGRESRPLPATVVVPLQAATKVTTLPDFPDDDDGRALLLSRFADEVMRPANAPGYGFLAEAEVDGIDVVVVAYGARRKHPRVTAAPIRGAGLGDFAEAEDLDARAMPWIAPLQRACEAAQPPDVMGFGLS